MILSRMTVAELSVDHHSGSKKADWLSLSVLQMSLLKNSPALEVGRAEQVARG